MLQFISQFQSPTSELISYIFNKFSNDLFMPNSSEIINDFDYLPDCIKYIVFDRIMPDQINSIILFVCTDGCSENDIIEILLKLILMRQSENRSIDVEFILDFNFGFDREYKFIHVGLLLHYLIDVNITISTQSNNNINFVTDLYINEEDSVVFLPEHFITIESILSENALENIHYVFNELYNNDLFVIHNNHFWQICDTIMNERINYLNIPIFSDLCNINIRLNQLAEIEHINELLLKMIF